MSQGDKKHENIKTIPKKSETITRPHNIKDQDHSQQNKSDANVPFLNAVTT